jgi:galactose mutarotase-like enzyme
MYTIQSETLTVQIATKGAELQSIYNKQTNLEYLWDANPAFWAKKSPVLFPIVGGLKNNSYTYKGKTYHLSRHGFARDKEFLVTVEKDDLITFSLKSDDETFKVYPFHFLFSIEYAVSGNVLTIEYSVENTGNEEMVFSVGAHPAFKLPLIEHTSFDDYYLHFNSIENAGRYPLSPDGLLEKEPLAVLDNTDHLPLKKSLFYEDALVFKHLRSNSIAIKSDKTNNGLKVSFPNFPYIGIWNAKDANFLCIEPWCGIADNVDASGIIQEKEGINTLRSQETFTREISIEAF